MIWAVKSIEPGNVAEMWPTVSVLLAPAVDRSDGRYDMRAVFRSLVDSQALLWVVYDETKHIHAAFVLHKSEYPCASYMTVDFLGGENMGLWLEDVERTVADFARKSGCDGVELFGREGWDRTLRPFGWRRNTLMLTKSFPAESGS